MVKTTGFDSADCLMWLFVRLIWSAAETDDRSDPDDVTPGLKLCETNAILKLVKHARSVVEVALSYRRHLVGVPGAKTKAVKL
jgi:hypothetical protein